MTKKRNTKRALMASLLSMVMCTSMLIGSTFAWFTDNAVTNVNTIQAGTLDIQLLDGNTKEANSLEGKPLSFAKAKDAHADEKVLFEPGAKYSLQQVWLHNAGNLHAKYQVVITGIGGSTKLAEVLDVYIDGEATGKTLMDLAANGAVINSSVIAPGAYYSFGTIALKMQETADNEYQGLSLEGLAITVQATQATVEYDSYNNTYDDLAEFDENLTVVQKGDQDALNKAIAKAEIGVPTVIDVADGTYTLDGKSFNKGADITIKGTKDTVIKVDQVFGINDSSITFDGVTVQFAPNSSYMGMQHSAKETYLNCTIIGQQFLYAPEVTFVNCEFKNSGDNYCVWTYAANATFTNCTFNCDGKAVLIYTEGAATKSYGFDNCTFNDNGTISDKAAIEIGESAYGNKANYTIYVNDCTVKGFDVTKQNSSTFGGTNLGTNVWGNKNLIPADRLNVIIDGEEVY